MCLTNPNLLKSSDCYNFAAGTNTPCLKLIDDGFAIFLSQLNLIILHISQVKLYLQMHDIITLGKISCWDLLPFQPRFQLA